MKTGVHRRTPRWGVRRYSLTASPRCAGALSQITLSGPKCLSFSCLSKADEVPALLFQQPTTLSECRNRYTGSPRS